MINKPNWRWFIPLFTSSLIFVNHYCRDSVGSLEKQLENEGKLLSFFLLYNSSL